MIRYTFGDDPPAVQRLGLVAAAYDETSRAFLADHGRPGAALALDLGCGPGFSTALVGEVLTPRRLIGIDSSSQFLELARARVPSAEFVVLDLAGATLPSRPELVYARLLLAHVPEPVALVRRWSGQLAAGGRVLVEDLEAVEAPPGPLRLYEEVSAAMVRGGGGVMYAGQALADLGGTCARVTVPAAAAATIYLFNVRRWQTSGPADLTDLEAGLEAVRDAGGGTVSWIVRQLALTA